MKSFALLVLTLAALQIAPPPAPPQGQRGTSPQPAASPQPAPLTAAQCKCSIEVTVKRSDTGEPISDVDVSITNNNTNPALAAVLSSQNPDPALLRSLIETNQAEQAAQTRTAVTDSSGHATIRDLAEGTYNVRVQRDGYMGPATNGNSATQISTSVRIGPANNTATTSTTAATNQTPRPVQQVTFSMIRGATISGKVLDASRRPASGVSVAAYRVAYRNGNKTLNQAGTAVQSDDRGEYRLYWFPPGEYFVRTTSEVRQLLQSQSYPTPTYYPGTTDPTRAVPIVLREGQELGGADFGLQPSAGVTVSGTIVNNMPGRVGPRGQVNRAVTSVFLVPRNPVFWESPTTIPNVRGAGARGANPDDPNSPFEIHGVPPGTYDLYPIYSSGSTDVLNGGYVTGRTVIEVGADDVSNVRAVLRPAVELHGHLTIMGTPPASQRPQPVNMANVRVNVQPADNLPSLASVAIRPSSIDADGAFTIPNMVDAKYFISSVSGIPADAYVSELRLGSQNFYNEGFFEIGQSAPESLEVVVTRGGGTIRVEIQDAQHKPVTGTSGIRFVLVPDPPDRKNLLRYKSGTTAGSLITLNGIAPGAYRVYAFEDIPQGAEQNEEFMRPFESRSVSVTVSAGLTSGNVVVQIIPAQH